MSSPVTYLKDGQKLGSEKLVRFNTGRNSIMRVDKIEVEGKDKRFYGINLYGDYHVAWGYNCLHASAVDKELWASYIGDRNDYYANYVGSNYVRASG